VELTLLETRGRELCLAIFGPPWVRSHLSEGMWIASLCHAEMAQELASLRAVVPSSAEVMLGLSRKKAFRVEDVDELVAEFQKQEEWQLRLERPDAKVCDLILGPPSGRA
jgi:hypothetical protein